MNACDSVNERKIVVRSDCREKIQYVSQSCDSLVVSLTYMGRTKIESRVIPLNQGQGVQKEVVITVSNVANVWRRYLVYGVVSLDKKHLLFVYMLVNIEKLNAIALGGINIKKAPQKRGFSTMLLKGVGRTNLESWCYYVCSSSFFKHYISYSDFKATKSTICF